MTLTHPPLELPRAHRVLLCAVAFAGSTVYALSFVPLHVPDATRIATYVGVAAGLSWLLFGATLLAATRGLPSLLSWMDACLVPIAWGIAIKMLGVFINLVLAHLDYLGRIPLLPAHAAILLTADAVMGTLFCHQANDRGISTPHAILLWLTLNAYFAVLLFTLIHFGGPR